MIAEVAALVGDPARDDHRVGERLLALQSRVPHPLAGILKAVKRRSVVRRR
jgi:hypothetical protein